MNVNLSVLIIFSLVCCLVLFVIYFIDLMKLRRQLRADVVYRDIVLRLIDNERHYFEYVKENKLSQSRCIMEYLEQCPALLNRANIDLANVKLEAINLRETKKLYKELSNAPEKLKNIFIELSEIFNLLAKTQHPIKWKLLKLKKNIEMHILLLKLNLCLILLKTESIVLYQFAVSHFFHAQRYRFIQKDLEKFPAVKKNTKNIQKLPVADKNSNTSPFGVNTRSVTYCAASHI